MLYWLIQTAAPIRILGIDPGSRITGYGIVDVDGSRLRLVECGVVQLSGDDFAARLKRIFDALGEVIGQHAPAEFAIEKIFVHRNVTSALKLGQARGAILSALGEWGIPVEELSPRAVKQAVTCACAAVEQLLDGVNLARGIVCAA